MKEEKKQLQQELYALERKLRPLEWDAARNQINEFKKKELARLTQEVERVKNQIASLA